MAAEDYEDIEYVPEYDDDEPLEPAPDALSEQEQKRLEEGQRLASIYLQSSNELLDCAKLEPDWLVPNAVPASAVSFAVGKPGCLSARTRIRINRNGSCREYTIEQLYHKFALQEFERGRPWDPCVTTQIVGAKGGKARLLTVKNVWCSGTKLLFRVSTASGKTVEATAEHRFLTPDGFVELRQLWPGAIVMVRGKRASGQNARTEGRRKFYKDVYTKYHPHQRKMNRTNMWRTPLHHVAFEAHANGFTVGEFLDILRNDAERSAKLYFIPRGTDVHHKDDDHTNNRPENLELLTRSEHRKRHRSTTVLALDPIIQDEIVSIVAIGAEPTYDIEVAEEPHNFLANDFVVHNSAKSWLAYDLALAVVQQRDWLGFGVPTAGLHPSAMILNFDNPHPECARRFLRLGLTRQDRLWVHSFGAHNPPEPLPAVLQLPDAYAPLESMVYALRPAVIIVDSLRQAHTGDESSSQEMARVMGQLKRMAMWGAAVVIVHHSRKNDGAMRGSTEIEATADSILDVEREADVSLVSWRKTRGWEMAEPTLSVSVVDEGDRTYVRGGLSVSALLTQNGPMARSAIAGALRLNQAQAKKLIDRGVERGTLNERRTSDGGRVIELVEKRT